MDELITRIRSCRECEALLPCGPKPIVQLHSEARILIASQAPGRLAHASGVPFQDPSGRRLREWMGLDEATFYNPRNVAILPMGFCYPGRATSGDLPPRPECAPRWRQLALEQLGNLQLILIIGVYAQRWHLGSAQTLTGLVRQGVQQTESSQTSIMALPHPSPRNNPWLKRNPWFEADVIPLLRTNIRAALD